MDRDELYHYYDEAVANIIGAMAEEFKDNKVIVFGRVDMQDKSHLCVLRIATLLSGIAGKPTYANISLFSYAWHWMTSKWFRKNVQWTGIKEPGHYMDTFLEDLSDDYQYDYLLLSAIYDAYYNEKELKKLVFTQNYEK